MVTAPNEYADIDVMLILSCANMLGCRDHKIHWEYGSYGNQKSFAFTIGYSFYDGSSS